MELGHYQLQIFISLIAILGAAIVAFICDFLKRNNEQLRELTIELKVRREEEQRHSRLLTPHPAEKAAAESAPAKASAKQIKPPVEKQIEAPAARTLNTSQALAAPAAARAERPLESLSSRKQRAEPPKRAIASEALAVMELAAQRAGNGLKPDAPVSAVNPQVVVAAKAPAATNKPKPKHEAIIETERLALLFGDKDETVNYAVRHDAPCSTATCSTTTPAVIKKDWGALLRRSGTSKPAEKRVNEGQPDLLAAVAAASVSPALSGPSLPAGFQDGYVLRRLVQSHQPVSGLVVSVGVNAPRKSDGALPEPVQKLIQSLIGPGDFAAQSGDGEFLLIYPQERGASAQRRLSQVAQQLWDFQLRSLGSLQILFSWGGVEVESESIEDAIASANERMQETRRGRKLLTMAGPAAVSETNLRQAV